MTAQQKHLFTLGGLALIAYAILSLLSGVLDFAAGPPPSPGAEILTWMSAQGRLLAFPSELLFFEAAFLVPGSIAVYRSLASTEEAWAVTGCGILALAITVMAFLAVIHGRLVYPVYGLQVRTPDIAAFAVALYFGGLHAIELLLGFAFVLLGFAMRHGVYGKRIAWFGFAAAALAFAAGYPYVIGPSAALVCQAVVAVWFVAVGRTLYRLPSPV